MKPPKKSLPKGKKPLIIACGALGKEIKFLLHQMGDPAIDLMFLPAIWHNHPEKIVPELETLVAHHKKLHPKIYIGYADCGTGGAIDKFITHHHLTRLAGAHCYQFFAGHQEFDKIMEQELGTFFLTDYLTRHFDELVWHGMGLAKHPTLLKTIFGNYKKLLYLAQTDNPTLTSKAKKASERLGLVFERRFTGYGLLGDFVKTIATKI